MAAIQLQNLYKIYKDGPIETVALRDAQLSINSGEFIAIRGRSGAGKSTLLNLLGGLTTPSAGQVRINGVDISGLSETARARIRRDQIGIVYQADNLIAFLTARENVALPLELAGHRDAHRRAQQLLTEVGLADRAQHTPGMLSGGERQRVAIAVALANNPPILLADELTGELDSATADQIMALLNDLNTRRNLTLVVVTHHPDVAARADRQLLIADGQIITQEAAHV